MTYTPVLNTARSVRRRWPGDTQPSAQQMDQLVGLSAMLARTQLMSKLGQSYDGKRDLYKALGYKVNLDFDDYWNKYKRQDIAKTIVDAAPKACWRLFPAVKENEDESDDTLFEKAWKDLEAELKLFSRFKRVDRLCGAGQYAVLMLGLSDVSTEQDLSQPVTKGAGLELLFVQPYKQRDADISEYETDPKSKRYGLPKIYNITVNNPDQSSGRVVKVHWERVQHVAHDPLDSDVFGTPKLENVFNRLENLELIAGGSGESFWRMAFPGLAFIADKDADIGTQDADDFTDEIDKYIHSLKRYIRLQAMKVEKLNTDVGDPSSHVDAQLKLIAGGAEIPLRILTGSERGELASSQDQSTWNMRVDERRKGHCEPIIIRPFIDRLIEFQILPKPTKDYWLDWQNLETPSDKDKAEVAKGYTEAISKYASSPGADLVVPPGTFRKRYLGFTDEENKDIEDEVEQMEQDEQRQMQEDLERQQAELEQQNKPSNQNPPNQGGQ